MSEQKNGVVVHAFLYPCDGIEFESSDLRLDSSSFFSVRKEACCDTNVAPLLRLQEAPVLDVGQHGL